MKDFAGMVAVVTGGSSGIGAETVRELDDRGASVVVLDVLAPTDPVQFQAVDVTDGQSVADAVTAVHERYGALDVLVNCAGIGCIGTVEQNTLDEWRRVFDVNLFGVVRMVRASLQHLRQSTRAAIVNVSSIAAGAGLPDRSAYTASKGAVQALTLALAADHVADRIRVNCVAPGTVDTPFVTQLLEQAQNPRAARDALVARQPIGRLVTAQEVAWSIAYLASPRSGSTTGTVLAVDGGFTGVRLPVERTLRS